MKKETLEYTTVCYINTIRFIIDKLLEEQTFPAMYTFDST